MSESDAAQKPRGEYGAGRAFVRGNRVYIRWSRNGKRYCKRTELTADDRNWERKAKKLLKLRAARKVLGLSDPAEANVTYENMQAALLARYESEGCRSLRHPAGRNPYIIGLNHLDAFFEGWRAVEIDSDALRAYTDQRRRHGVKGSTINRELSLLSGMFSLAVEDDKLDENSVPVFHWLKESEPREGFLEPEDYPKLRQQLPEHVRPIVSLGFHCAMRLGEITGLRWKWVDLYVDVDRGEIRIPGKLAKTKKPRIITLGGEPLELLRIEYQREPRGEFVFMRDGDRIQSFYKAWQRACCAAGLGKMEPIIDPKTGNAKFANPRPDRKRAKAKPQMRYSGLIFHDLRRSGVRNLVRAGVTEGVAMRISGHKTRSVFDRYDIKDDRDLRDAAQKLEIYLAAKVEGNKGDTNATAPREAPQATEVQKPLIQ